MVPSVSLHSSALAKASHLIKTFLKFYFMTIGMLPACMPVHHVGTWDLRWPLEEALLSPEAGVTNHGDMTCGCWELNLIL